MGKVKGKAAKTLKKKAISIGASRSKRRPSLDALFGPLRSRPNKSQQQQQQQQQQHQRSPLLFHRSTSFATSSSVASSQRTKQKRNSNKNKNNIRKRPPHYSRSYSSLTASNNISSSSSSIIQLHLPSYGKEDLLLAGDDDDIPWLTTEEPQLQQSIVKQQRSNTNNDNNDNKKKKKKKKYCRLPADDIPIHWMMQLDAELQAFATYVQLSKPEIMARQAIIQEFQHIAQQVFSSSNNNTERQQHKRWNYYYEHDEQKQQNEPSVGFQVFGSFATPAVCVFTSDVDLALHGVVPPPPPPPPPPPAAAAQQLQPKRPPQESAINNNSNNKKQKRILRWKQALAAMEEDNLAAPSPAEPISKKRPRNVLVVCESKEEKYTQNNASAISVQGGERNNNNNNNNHDMAIHNDDGHQGMDGGSQNRKDQDKGSTSLLSLSSVNLKPQAATPTTPTSQQDNNNNMDDTILPLFVIDRVGVVVTNESSSSNNNNNAAAVAATEDNNNDNRDLDAKKSSQRRIRQIITVETVHQNENTSLQEEGPPVAFINTAVDNEDNYVDEASAHVDHGDDDNESDNDSADKLEAFRSNNKSTVSDTLMNQLVAADKPAVSLSDSDDSSDDDDNCYDTDNTRNAPDDEMEVSFVSNPVRGRNNQKSRSNSIGPTGYVRMQVVSALSTLSNKLRKSSKTRKVTLIKTARVPIAKIETAEGIEIDIAVGGHNGTDTSNFAAKQMEKFESFGTVVLFLKVLLNQQKLDIPFMGGLGSYKLYVMVAYHIQQHMALGGEDRPGEVLLTFLFRYGCVNGHNVDDKARTRLEQHVPLQYTSDCFADLSNVRHLDHIVHLFRNSFMRLWKHVNICIQQEKKKSSNSFSQPGLLACLIHKDRLRAERDASLQKIKALCQFDSRSKRVPEQSSPRAAKLSRSRITENVVEVQYRGDLSEEELMKGYRVTKDQLKGIEQAMAAREKRGSRGPSSDLAKLRAAKRLRSDSNSDIAAKNWNDLSAEELMQGYGVTREQLEWVGHHKI